MKYSSNDKQKPTKFIKPKIIQKDQNYKNKKKNYFHFFTIAFLLNNLKSICKHFRFLCFIFCCIFIQ